LQESYDQRFLLSVQIIKQNHNSISIFPTIIYGSTLIKAQSALSVSANS